MNNVEQLTKDIQNRIREIDSTDELFEEVDDELYNEDEFRI